MHDRINNLPWGWIAIATLVLAIGAVWVNGLYQDLEESQIATCERNKLDRIDNARAFTADVEYLEKVVIAGSVQEDVKRAARAKVQRISESANQLRTRLLHCDVLIEDGRLEIDERALREARGEL
jgi:hypothetical protein